MKRYIPLVCVIVFIVALLGFSNYIWYEQQRQQEEQSSYETERHIVAVSDMPADVNAELSAAFYKQTGMHVQIISKTDDELHQQMKTAHDGEMPDVLIAAEPVLRQAAAIQQLKPYASIQTETVPYAFKDADGYWNGLWLNPMVFVVSYEYHARRGIEIHTWDDLLRDPMLTIAFPDLASMDMAGDFLCSLVEVNGSEEAGLYLRALQSHVAAYSKSMASSVRRVASGEVNLGVVDAVTARQYRQDGAPIYILYPRDGTSYWLTGAAVTVQCQDEELAAAFVEWLYSPDVDAVLRKNHLYFTYASETARKILDSQGQELVLFPTKKQYTDAGRRDLQNWWIKSVRFGKDE